MTKATKKPFFSSYEDNYYRVALALAGLLYLTQRYAGGEVTAINEFLIPRVVMGLLPIAIVLASIAVSQVREKLSDIAAGYFIIASLHVVGLLSTNDSFSHDAFIVFIILFFTNLQLTRILQIVIYNITMLATIEYAFITSGFGKGIHPVAFFLILVLVILMCAAYQLFRIRSAASGKERENLLSELVSGNPDAWIVFEGNGLIAREAGTRAMELFGLRERDDLGTFSLRNIITAGSPFEADRIISEILEGKKVELRTLCRKPSGELFWSELAVFRIPGADNEYFCRFFDISEFLNSKEVANATAIRYRSYLDTMQDGLIITDQNLFIILANKSASIIAGQEASGGNTAENLFSDEDILRLRSAVTAPVITSSLSEPRPVKLNNGTTAILTYIIENDPVEQTRELVLFLKENSGQISTGIVSASGGSHDDDNALMRALGKGSVPACTVNTSGHFVLCNKAFSDLCGYGPKDLAMLTLENIAHPSDAQNARHIISTVNEKAGELHILTGDGNEKKLRVSGLSAGDGKYKLLIWEDVTDLLAARAELEQSGSRISAVIENTQSPVAAIDFNHRITFMNSAFRNELLKRTGRNPVTGDDIRELLTDEGRNRWESAYPAVMSGKRHFEDEGITYSDGRRAWFESSYTPVTLPSGAVSGITLFMRDVTDRITFQNDLVQARNQAESATKAKSGFLATMSHEIRTPLNGLLGMTELLTGTALNNEQKSYLDSIRVSGEALLSIINDVLDYSKIESEMMVLEQKPFSIAGTVRETFDMLRYRANEKGNSLSLQVEQNVPDIITGDKVRLRQVLLNLTGNAIKFTQNGTIDITVKIAEQSSDGFVAQFTVKDTGIGIPADKMDRLFKSFSQADESTFSQFGGTGLGLAISAKLVALMGGTIRAESEHGKGSSFIFTIKTKAATEQTLTPSEKIKPAAKSAVSISILVAEDNPVNQKVAKAMLEKMGHTVTIAANGKEAAEAAVSGNYPVIFMDVQMPEMDGLEATRQIRMRMEGKVQPAIIAMTAQALEGDREACIEAGMDDYISKPVTASAFAEKLQQWGKTKTTPAVPGNVANASTQGILDMEIIERLRALGDGDNSFLESIINLYKEQSTETISELEKNIRSRDANAIWQSAHKLKGASLNLGARETGDWCRRIEEASKAGEETSYDSLYHELRSSFRNSIEALEKLLR